jgi:hypothetical protein
MAGGASAMLLIYVLTPAWIWEHRATPTMQRPVAAARVATQSAARAADPTQAAGWRTSIDGAADRRQRVEPARTPSRLEATTPGNALRPSEARIASEPAAPEPAVRSAPPAPAPNANPSSEVGFDRKAAAEAIRAAADRAAACGNTGRREATRIAVTFAPSGRATTAVIEGDSSVRGTPLGSCVAREMRNARVPPFSGGLVTVHSSLSLF